MFKPHEFAKKIGVSVKTLQRWDSVGKLPAKRTLSGHRFYTEDDLLIAQGLKPIESKRKVIVYCRVSSSGQKPELKNQISAMETFCLEDVCQVKKSSSNDILSVDKKATELLD